MKSGINVSVPVAKVPTEGSDFNICFSKNDFPVPAAPVKKIDAPDLTKSSTFYQMEGVKNIRFNYEQQQIERS